MVSSIYAKMIEFIRQAKRERNATEEGIQPENDQQQHQQVAVGGVSAGAVSSDSTVQSGEVQARGPKGRFTKKSAAAPAKENGRRDRKKVQ